MAIRDGLSGTFYKKITDREIIDQIDQERDYHTIQMMCQVLVVLKNMCYQLIYRLKSLYKIDNEAGLRE
ncbi:hypothetical protein BEP19_12865 [Ammoniphilus oxalaticus]|uniref:Uncharacterized protein n=1 Tax=Ammoniphilus oxalaticus TaxID=66863 RepID=A0A419SH48_9BACL|nr:hypothetical protein BEP19_12865 [Ammoniphilus oxalaticus]